MANIVLCCMVYVYRHCLYGVAYFIHLTEHISPRLIFTPLISHIKTVTDTITVNTSYEYGAKSLKYNSFYASHRVIFADLNGIMSLSLHINGVGQEPPQVPYVIYTYKYTDQVNLVLTTKVTDALYTTSITQRLPTGGVWTMCCINVTLP